MPDFGSMTLDELVDWRVAKKAEAVAIQEEIRASNATYHWKVAVAQRARRLGTTEAEAEVIERELAKLNLSGDELAKPGGKVIEPGVGSLTTTAHEGEVS